MQVILVCLILYICDMVRFVQQQLFSLCFFVLGDSMSSVRSDTFVVVPSVSRLTPEQKKESLFEAAKTGKKIFILSVNKLL